MRRKVLALILSLAMVLSMAVPAMAAEDMSGKLVIIHTNDMHGYYEAGEGCIGIAGVAAIKDHYEALGADVLLFDGGDFSQGKSLVNYYKGTNVGDYMVAAGYDAITLGNHELDFGFDALLENVATLEAAGIKVLSANFLKKGTTEPYFGDNTVFEFDGLKVGVFGLETAETLTKVNPEYVKGIEIADKAEMFAIAEAQVKELEAAGCDVIVAIGHLGVDAESTGRRSTDLLEEVEGIDLFIDGHSHTEMDGGQMVGETLVTSTGSYLANVGVVVYDKAAATFEASLMTAEEFAAEVGTYDAATEAIVGEDVAEVSAAYSAIIGETLHDLNGNKAPGVRTEETNLGDFGPDAYVYAAKKYVEEMGMDIVVDGGIQNGGGIRASIPAGEISMDTLVTVFPFGNTVALVTITGEQLLEALEASTFCTPEAVGGFPQVSGIKFTLNTSVEFVSGDQYPDSTYYAPANPGSRVTIESVGGKAWKADEEYTIAVNNFMAAGGDTFYVLKEGSFSYDTEIVDSEALIDYFVNGLGGVIGDEYAAPQGRITITDKPVIKPIVLKNGLVTIIGI